MSPDPAVPDVSRAGRRRFRFDFTPMRFALVGVLNTATDFLVFTFFYVVLGVPILIANMIGVATAVIVSFVANRHWTFAAARNARLDGRQQFVRHVTLALLTLVVSSLVIYACASFMPALLAKLFASGCTFLLSFLISRHWVFAKDAA